jgi:hypothetical protein
MFVGLVAIPLGTDEISERTESPQRLAIGRIEDRGQCLISRSPPSPPVPQRNPTVEGCARTCARFALDQRQDSHRRDSISIGNRSSAGLRRRET